MEESCVQSRRTRIKTGSKCTWVHPSRVRISHYTALSFRRKNKNISALTWTLQDETNSKHRNVISLLNKAADSREESLMTLFFAFAFCSVGTAFCGMFTRNGKCTTKYQGSPFRACNTEVTGSTSFGNI